MLFTEQANQIFNRAIVDYHVTDHVDTPIHNPYPKESIEYRLYLKCWIDTVQWHFEDLIRDPHINPVNALPARPPHRVVRTYPAALHRPPAIESGGQYPPILPYYAPLRGLGQHPLPLIGLES